MGPKSGRRYYAPITVRLPLALLMMACGDGADAPQATGPEAPTLTVVLTSGNGSTERAALSGGIGSAADELWVKIEDICFQGLDDGGRSQCLLPEATGWLNIDDWNTLAEEVEVPSGTAQMRFIIVEAALIADGKAYPTTAVDLFGDPPVPSLEEVGQLHCPSCSRSGIKIIFPDGEPTMQEGENFLVAEFDVEESLGRPRGASGRWVMHPVIRGSLVLKARLTVDVVGEGTVTSSPEGISCPGDCSQNFAAGESVALTATAADGWSFVEWTGDCSGTETTAVVQLDVNRSCTATFEQTTTATIRGTVSVDANATFDGSALPGTCGGVPVDADTLVKYFRPFMSNGASHEAATNASGGYELTDLPPGIYDLGWISAVAFRSGVDLAFFAVTITDPDAQPNDRVTEVLAGQTAIVDYLILQAFCSD